MCGQTHELNRKKAFIAIKAQNEHNNSPNILLITINDFLFNDDLEIIPCYTVSYVIKIIAAVDYLENFGLP
ncbi:19_t:CDS:1, partial [Rhizophagus irregularis]